MARLYLLIFIVGIIGIVGYGAKYYYDTTQNRIAILTKNNTKLKVAIETSEKSINNLKVSEKLLSFINDKLLPDINISHTDFWFGFDKAVHELAPKNK